MKIVKIKFKNHQIFKNSCFDFRKSNGKIYDNILIAGENGAGKTTFLEIFTQFSTIFTSAWYDDIKSHMPDLFGNSYMEIEFEHEGEFFYFLQDQKMTIRESC